MRAPLVPGINRSPLEYPSRIIVGITNRVDSVILGDASHEDDAAPGGTSAGLAVSRQRDIIGVQWIVLSLSSQPAVSRPTEKLLPRSPQPFHRDLEGLQGEVLQPLCFLRALPS